MTSVARARTAVNRSTATRSARRVAAALQPRAGRLVGTAGGRPLGRYANNSSPARPTPVDDEAARRARRNSKRRERYSLRYRLREVTALKRVKDCGHTPITGGDVAGPALRVSSIDGRAVAGLTGLAHCASVWACPVCSAKIATRRAEDLADVMRYALEQGCSASMVTLTMRHHKGQSLRECWDALGYAWSRVTSGKQWVQDQQTAGLQGWVKAVEATHGANGWHVHLHVLMIWRDQVGQESAQAVGERMWSRWTSALQRRGFDSLQRSGGLDVRLAALKPGAGSGLHEYFVKLSHEITGGQAKLAKGAGRTPFQLLTDVFDLGDADDLEHWWEWEQSSRGRRQISWSKGLREWAQLGEEQTDEAIAEEELDGDDLLLLPSESWRSLRTSPDRVCDLLEAAEASGLDAAAALLDGWGLAWLAGRRPPPYNHRAQVAAG